MKKVMITAASTLFITGAAFSAMADSHGGNDHPEHKPRNHMDRMFERADSNADGVISKDEFIAHAEEKFSKMDADKDGTVTKDEAKRHHEEKRKMHEKMHENRMSE